MIAIIIIDGLTFWVNDISHRG